MHACAGTALRPPLLGAHAEGQVAARERQPEAQRNAWAEQRRRGNRRRGRRSGAGERDAQAKAEAATSGAPGVR